MVFNVGRRIRAPSLFDFSLVNSVRDMWLAGSEVKIKFSCRFQWSLALYEISFNANLFFPSNKYFIP